MYKKTSVSLVKFFCEDSKIFKTDNWLPKKTKKNDICYSACLLPVLQSQHHVTFVFPCVLGDTGLGGIGGGVRFNGDPFSGEFYTNINSLCKKSTNITDISKY